MSGQPNRDLFFSQSKKSGSGPAQAGAASLDSCPGLVIRFLVACCLTGLSLRLLSLFSQDSCFTSRQKEKENAKARVHPSEPSGRQYVDSKTSAIVRGCGQFLIPCSVTDTFSNPHWGPHCRAEEGPVIKMIEWKFVLLILKHKIISRGHLCKPMRPEIHTCCLKNRQLYSSKNHTIIFTLRFNISTKNKATQCSSYLSVFHSNTGYHPLFQPPIQSQGAGAEIWLLLSSRNWAFKWSFALWEM